MNLTNPGQGKTDAKGKRPCSCGNFKHDYAWNVYLPVKQEK